MVAGVTFFRKRRSLRTDRWTEILFRALTARVAQRWRFISFRGKHGGERHELERAAANRLAKRGGLRPARLERATSWFVAAFGCERRYAAFY
jgi:hypothetical protein